MRSLLGGMVLAMLVASASLHATSVNDVILGKTESGTNLTPKDLKGKVVLVAFWGVH